MPEVLVKESEKIEESTAPRKTATPKKPTGAKQLLRRLFKLKIDEGSAQRASEKPQKKLEARFQTERSQEWNEILMLPAEEFVKRDQLARERLLEKIPADLGKLRFQDLIVPNSAAPIYLRKIFQYLSHLVRKDLGAASNGIQGASGANYRPLTFIPSKKTNPNDWYAVNLMIMQNLASLVYGISRSFCNSTTCPRMTIGSNYEYMWCDGESVLEPIPIPATAYLKFCLLWAGEQLKSPKNIGPAGYPVGIHETWRLLYRRIIRIFMHAYVNHGSDFAALHPEMEDVLSAMLRRCILLGLETKLASKRELEPIKDIVKRTQREFRINQACCEED